MPKFNYIALDSQGKEVSGVLETDTSTTAVSRIREMGYFPTNITEADKKKTWKKSAQHPGSSRKSYRKPASGGMNIVIGGRVKPKSLMTFTRGLATLIDAGLPLLRGLSVLRRQEKSPILRNALLQIGEAVEAGSTFSEALAQHPKIFSRLFINMVRAGEAGGVLDVTLNRLADFQEKAQKIKNKVVAAMVYPAVVILVAIVILSFLMIVIVPKFKEIFADLLEGESLPALTTFVMELSRMMRDQFLLMLISVVAVVIVIIGISKTTRGRYILDTIKLNAPVFGSLFRKVSVSRFTRTLGTLVASGVPILQALNIVRETAGNAVVAKAIGLVHDSVKEGESIVQPLEASRVFDPMVVSMIEVGEQTGALPDMLMKIADVYDDEVDNAVQALTSLLEPVMIVFLALFVGTIVIALFLPLVSIIEKLGG